MWWAAKILNKFVMNQFTMYSSDMLYFADNSIVSN